MSIYSMFDGYVHGDLWLENLLVRKYFICSDTFCFKLVASILDACCLKFQLTLPF